MFFQLPISHHYVVKLFLNTKNTNLLLQFHLDNMLFRQLNVFLTFEGANFLNMFRQPSKKLTSVHDIVYRIKKTGKGEGFFDTIAPPAQANVVGVKYKKS